MNVQIARWILLVAVACAMSGPVVAATPAERLLANVQGGKPPATEQVVREASALLLQLDVPKWMRQHDSIMYWETKVLQSGTHVPEVQNEIIIVNGPVSIGRARYAIVIASGDVVIESGSALLVVTQGSIRFSHDADMDWSGVFVARGKMIAPWVGNMVVHAAAGLELSESSANVIAIDTAVRTPASAEIEHRAVGAIFSDSVRRRGALEAARPKPELPYAGRRCANSSPLREIGQHVPAIARSKAKCDGPVSLLIASCVKSDASASEELWTVHLCQNVIVDVTARRRGAKSEFAFYSRLPSVPEPAGGRTADLKRGAPGTYGAKSSPKAPR